MIVVAWYYYKSSTLNWWINRILFCYFEVDGDVKDEESFWLIDNHDKSELLCENRRLFGLLNHSLRIFKKKEFIWLDFLTSWVAYYKYDLNYHYRE